MSERPRRSTVKTEKAQAAADATATPVRSAKRKAADPKEQLKHLLQNPKSKLTMIELSDVINAGAWNLLSQESQRVLRNLLPPTAFSGYRTRIEANHSSVLDVAKRDEDESNAPGEEKELNLAVFTDPHFLAAASTFQDHIYLSWTSDSHLEKVRKFQDGIASGILAAPWKDEIWDREHATIQPISDSETTSVTTSARAPAESSQRAGGATELKLTTLAKYGVIKVGDILAYRRNFSSIDLILEKDCIIQDINPKSYCLTVLTEQGPTKLLAPSLVNPAPAPRIPEDASDSTRSMVVTSPTMLETSLLDLDGRVDRSKRPNGNAWKCFTVWRRRENATMSDEQNGRAGRENYGTLFYLRGSFYHDQ